MNPRQMSISFFIAVIAWLALILSGLPAACAENATPDSEQSSRLTDFLKSHRLPLVSAQVLRSPDGRHSVMLYGYTATETGKTNAEKRTRLFLNEPTVSITNRIKVRPELASMKSRSASPPPSEASANPPYATEMEGIQSYQNQQSQAGQRRYIDQQIQQYANQQNSPSTLENTLIPLIALGLAIGLGATGKGIGVPPGFGQPYPYNGPGYRYTYPYGPNPRCNP